MPLRGLLDPDCHYSRSPVGHALENRCVCPKQGCGLIAGDQVDDACPDHAMWFRGVFPLQRHRASQCPARPRQVPAWVSTGPRPRPSGGPRDARRPTGR